MDSLGDLDAYMTGQEDFNENDHIQEEGNDDISDQNNQSDRNDQCDQNSQSDQNSQCDQSDQHISHPINNTNHTTITEFTDTPTTTIPTTTNLTTNPTTNLTANSTTNPTTNPTTNLTANLTANPTTIPTPPPPSDFTTHDIDSKPPNPRTFLGNHNYVDFYNQHVNECVLPQDLLSTPWIPSLFSPSVITPSLDVYYTRYKGIAGTTWSPTDKEKFFRALALYLIHRIDDIVAFIGGKKSRSEVWRYYRLLKRDLSRRKSTRPRVYRYMAGSLRTRVVLPRVRRTLMLYDEMPIAYEMSEGFIRFEEQQAELISLKEKTRIIDQNRHFGKQFNADECLVDPKNMALLAKRVLGRRAVRSGELTLAPKPDIKGLALFEELARIVTERILYGALEWGAKRGALSRKEVFRAAKRCGYVLWNDVWKDVAEECGGEEEEEEQDHVIEEEENEEHEENEENEDNENEEGSGDENEVDANDGIPYVHTVDPFYSFSVDQSTDLILDTESESPEPSEPLPISELGQPKVEHLTTDLTLALLSIVETKMDRTDYTDLRMHERGLVTKLSAGVEMYSRSEAKEIVKGWKYERKMERRERREKRRKRRREESQNQYESQIEDSQYDSQLIPSQYDSQFDSQLSQSQYDSQFDSQLSQSQYDSQLIQSKYDSQFDSQLIQSQLIQSQYDSQFDRQLDNQVDTEEVHIKSEEEVIGDEEPQDDVMESESEVEEIEPSAELLEYFSRVFAEY